MHVFFGSSFPLFYLGMATFHGSRFHEFTHSTQFFIVFIFLVGVAHFKGDGQITESRISQEMPNHRAAHFTGDAKSQKRAFHELPVFTHFSSLFHFSSFGFENLIGPRTFFCKPFFFRTFFFQKTQNRRQTSRQKSAIKQPCKGLKSLDSTACWNSSWWSPQISPT